MTEIGNVNIRCNRCGNWRRVPVLADVVPVESAEARRYTVRMAGEVVGQIFIRVRGGRGDHVCQPRVEAVPKLRLVTEGETDD